MSEYLAHLSQDDNPLLTLCGEPWQGWQAPEGYTDIPGHVELPPHDKPRPHKDQIRQCQACAKLAREQKTS